MQEHQKRGVLVGLWLTLGLAVPLGFTPEAHARKCTTIQPKAKGKRNCFLDKRFGENQHYMPIVDSRCRIVGCDDFGRLLGKMARFGLSRYVGHAKYMGYLPAMYVAQEGYRKLLDASQAARSAEEKAVTRGDEELAKLRRHAWARLDQELDSLRRSVKTIKVIRDKAALWKARYIAPEREARRMLKELEVHRAVLKSLETRPHAPTLKKEYRRTLDVVARAKKADDLLMRATGKITTEVGEAANKAEKVARAVQDAAIWVAGAACTVFSGSRLVGCLCKAGLKTLADTVGEKLSSNTPITLGSVGRKAFFALLETCGDAAPGADAVLKLLMGPLNTLLERFKAKARQWLADRVSGLAAKVRSLVGKLKSVLPDKVVELLQTGSDEAIASLAVEAISCAPLLAARKFGRLWSCLKAAPGKVARGLAKGLGKKALLVWAKKLFSVETLRSAWGMVKEHLKELIPGRVRQLLDRFLGGPLAKFAEDVVLEARRDKCLDKLTSIKAVGAALRCLGTSMNRVCTRQAKQFLSDLKSPARVRAALRSWAKFLPSEVQPLVTEAVDEVAGRVAAKMRASPCSPRKATCQGAVIGVAKCVGGALKGLVGAGLTAAKGVMKKAWDLLKQLLQRPSRSLLEQVLALLQQIGGEVVVAARSALRFVFENLKEIHCGNEKSFMKMVGCVVDGARRLIGKAVTALGAAAGRGKQKLRGALERLRRLARALGSLGSGLVDLLGKAIAGLKRISGPSWGELVKQLLSLRLPRGGGFIEYVKKAVGKIRGIFALLLREGLPLLQQALSAAIRAGVDKLEAWLGAQGGSLPGWLGKSLRTASKQAKQLFVALVSPCPFMLTTDLGRSIPKVLRCIVEKGKPALSLGALAGVQELIRQGVRAFGRSVSEGKKALLGALKKHGARLVAPLGKVLSQATEAGAKTFARTAEPCAQKLAGLEKQHLRAVVQCLVQTGRTAFAAGAQAGKKALLAAVKDFFSGKSLGRVWKTISANFPVPDALRGLFDGPAVVFAKKVFAKARRAGCFRVHKLAQVPRALKCLGRSAGQVCTAEAKSFVGRLSRGSRVRATLYQWTTVLPPSAIVLVQSAVGDAAKKVARAVRGARCLPRGRLTCGKALLGVAACVGRALKSALGTLTKAIGQVPAQVLALLKKLFRSPRGGGMLRKVLGLLKELPKQMVGAARSVLQFLVKQMRRIPCANEGGLPETLRCVVGAAKGLVRKGIDALAGAASRGKGALGRALRGLKKLASALGGAGKGIADIVGKALGALRQASKEAIRKLAGLLATLRLPEGKGFPDFVKNAAANLRKAFAVLLEMSLPLLRQGLLAAIRGGANKLHRWLRAKGEGLPAPLRKALRKASKQAKNAFVTLVSPCPYQLTVDLRTSVPKVIKCIVDMSKTALHTGVVGGAQELIRQGIQAFSRGVRGGKRALLQALRKHRAPLVGSLTKALKNATDSGAQAFVRAAMPCAMRLTVVSRSNLKTVVRCLVDAAQAAFQASKKVVVAEGAKAAKVLFDQAMSSLSGHVSTLGAVLKGLARKLTKMARVRVRGLTRGISARHLKKLGTGARATIEDARTACRGKLRALDRASLKALFGCLRAKLSSELKKAVKVVKGAYSTVAVGIFDANLIGLQSHPGNAAPALRALLDSLSSVVRGVKRSWASSVVKAIEAAGAGAKEALKKAQGHCRRHLKRLSARGVHRALGCVKYYLRRAKSRGAGESSSKKARPGKVREKKRGTKTPSTAHRKRNRHVKRTKRKKKRGKKKRSKAKRGKAKRSKAKRGKAKRSKKKRSKKKRSKKKRSKKKRSKAKRSKKKHKRKKKHRR